MFLLLRHRYRHLRDDLSDAALPRAGTRVQRTGDWQDGFLYWGSSRSWAFPFTPIARDASTLRWLLMFGLSRPLRYQYAVLCSNHTRRLGVARAPAPSSAAWLRAANSRSPPPSGLTLGGVPPARLKLASGLFNRMRNLGGAIGIAACATLLNDRTNLHFLRLAEQLRSTGESLVSFNQPGGLQQLRALVLREAQTQTIRMERLFVLDVLLCRRSGARAVHAEATTHAYAWGRALNAASNRIALDDPGRDGLGPTGCSRHHHIFHRADADDLLLSFFVLHDLEAEDDPARFDLRESSAHQRAVTELQWPAIFDARRAPAPS